jgi:hypothetical protein
VVVAGDFNLIRSPNDKSLANIDIPRMRMFNDCIADLALREMTRVGARYTWSNNRVDPIRSVQDQVFVSVEWEMAFFLIAVLAAQLGTPRGRYDEQSGKFSLSMKPRFNRTSRRKKPLLKVDASWLWHLLQRIHIWRLSGA